jgi:hypothetical protein
MILNQFNFLTSAELIILEQHLKLGTAHLKQHLSNSEMSQILSANPLSQADRAKMGLSGTEIIGNLLLILNTIFTATFGAWMGYFGFWEFSLGSFWVLGCIIVIAASIGAFIGFQNIKSTKKQASILINNQILKHFQLEILKKINQKRREEIEKIERGLNELFSTLSQGTFFEKKIFVLNLKGKSKSEISEWAETVKAMGKEKLEVCFDGLVPKEISEEWMEIQEELKQNAISCFEEKAEVFHFESQKAKNAVFDSFLKKLISISPKVSAAPLSWITSNARSLLLGLAPTLLGGFSSLTVYLRGVPLILKNFGYEKSVIFFTNPEAKMVEFAISVLLTCYFGFSFVYTNRKVFKRHQELEKTNKNIIQMEASLTVLDAEILKLKEVKRSALQLMRFFRIVDKFLMSQRNEMSVLH